VFGLFLQKAHNVLDLQKHPNLQPVPMKNPLDNPDPRSIAAKAFDLAPKSHDPLVARGPLPAIARCILASRRARDGSRAMGASPRQSEAAANRAFLRAMPPLSGYDNICDFIACVTHAIVTGVLRQQDAVPLLKSARHALAVERYSCEVGMPGAA
jgi:hypothetical protein